MNLMSCPQLVEALTRTLNQASMTTMLVFDLRELLITFLTVNRSIFHVVLLVASLVANLVAALITDLMVFLAATLSVNL